VADLRSILLDSDVWGNIPQNDGLYRPVTIVAPRGCIANPIFPAPTIARFAPGNVVADTLMRAPRPAVPEQVSAGVANLKAVTFSGFAGEQQWVHIEIFEGSYGGRLHQDGLDSVDTLYANTRNNPIEDIESHVPLRVTRYELREDAVAPGRWRGGLNSIKEMQFLTTGHDQRRGRRPCARAVGIPGRRRWPHLTAAARARRGRTQPLPSMLASVAVDKGDRIRAIGGVGGGYGNALERDPSSCWRMCSMAT
jgi:N-methylhydantoinase B